MKRLIVLGTLAGLAVGAIVLRQRPAAGGVDWVEVRKGTISARGMFNGTVMPRSRYSVGAPVAGRVANVYVGLGDRVAAGQVLARLDSSRSRGDVLRKRNALERARIRVKLHELTRDTTPAWRLNLDLLNLDVAQAEADYRDSLKEDDLATLRSGGAGIVVVMNLRIGDFISPGNSAAPIVVASTDQCQVDVEADEREAADVRAGDEAQVSLDSNLAPQTVRGAVAGAPFLLRPRTPFSNAVFGFSVLLDGKEACRIGTTTRVEVLTAVARDVATVPVTALLRTENGPVVVARDARRKLRVLQVVVGLTDNDAAEIRSGVSIGTTVASADLSRLRQLVREAE